MLIGKKRHIHPTLAGSEFEISVTPIMHAVGDSGSVQLTFGRCMVLSLGADEARRLASALQGAADETVTLAAAERVSA